MSNYARAYVERFSPYRGAVYQIHSAVADQASDQTDPPHHFWMSMGKLAKKARVERGTASRAMKQLVAEGWVAVVDDGRDEHGNWRGDTVEYALLFPKVPVVYEAKSRTGDPGGGARSEHTPPEEGAPRRSARGGARPARTGCAPGTQGVRAQRAQTKETRTGTTKPPPAPQGGRARQERLIEIEDLPAKDQQPVRAVFDAWIASTGRTGRTTLDAKRTRLIRSALKDYPLPDVIAAVEGWAHIPHNAGRNDGNRPWNDLGLLLRDAGNIERFRDARLNEPRVIINNTDSVENVRYR